MWRFSYLHADMLIVNLLHTDMLEKDYIFKNVDSIDLCEKIITSSYRLPFPEINQNIASLNQILELKTDFN